jgi:histidinol phosphatase-like enzyme (inositol monophosphatase family)
MKPSDDDLRAFAERLADAAREAILPHFRGSVEPFDKGSIGAAPAFDPVTEADRGAERVMRALIEETYPDHGILGEEYGEKPGGPFRWTLDPVDGTRAFIAGVPVWGTLIALTEEGSPRIGVIDQAYLDERYVGTPSGSYARMRGVARKLEVRRRDALKGAIVATTDPFLFNGAEAGAYEMVRRTARLARYGLDCYAYAQVAAGHVDLVVESGLKPWDYLALIPVIEGAGGLVTNWRGEGDFSAGQIAAAGDRRVLDDALVALRRAAA